MHKSSISCGNCHGDYISRYVFTGTQALSSLATDPLGPRWPNAVKRSFTSIQTVHTHTPCCSRVGEMEMKMRWPWKWNQSLPNRDTRQGTQKEERKKGRKHQHQHTYPKRANLKGQGKRKGGRTMTKPTRREPNLPRHVQDTNLT